MCGLCVWYVNVKLMNRNECGLYSYFISLAICLLLLCSCGIGSALCVSEYECVCECVMLGAAQHAHFSVCYDYVFAILSLKLLRISLHVLIAVSLQSWCLSSVVYHLTSPSPSAYTLLPLQGNGNGNFVCLSVCQSVSFVWFLLLLSSLFCLELPFIFC